MKDSSVHLDQSNISSQHHHPCYAQIAMHNRNPSPSRFYSHTIGGRHRQQSPHHITAVSILYRGQHRPTILYRGQHQPAAGTHRRAHLTAAAAVSHTSSGYQAVYFCIYTYTAQGRGSCRFSAVHLTEHHVQRTCRRDGPVSLLCPIYRIGFIIQVLHLYLYNIDQSFRTNLNKTTEQASFLMSQTM